MILVQWNTKIQSGGPGYNYRFYFYGGIKEEIATTHHAIIKQFD